MPLARAKRRERPIDAFTLRYIHRRVCHLTPRYALDLIGVLAFELTNPDAPWLTKQAFTILSTVLRPGDVGLEYGSGRSTIWFATRTQRLVSIETDQRWYQKVQSLIFQKGLSDRVRYQYIPADESNPYDPYRSSYLSVAEELPRQSLDYVLVDGLYRDECAVRVAALVKLGGLLIVDNINLFVPSRSRSPLSVASVQSGAWEQFLSLVRNWRLIWTSSGVTDTAIWIRSD